MKWLIFNLIQKITFSTIFWRQSKNIYLTFDDGPDSTQTPVLLDILKKYGAKATFFVVGENIASNKAILKRLSDEGHTIANHTYKHIRYKKNLKEFLSDVERCELAMRNANLPTKHLFRVPYGTINLKLFIGLLSNGYRIAFWNKDTKDYKLKSQEEVDVYMKLQNVQNGDVILMHDHPEVTPHILERILVMHSDKRFVSL